MRPPCLDLGCGTGALTRHLAGRNHPFVGVDISMAMLRGAADSMKRYLRFVNANAYMLPFRDGTFGTVICNGSLHHMLDLPHVLGEVRRVSKKDAQLLVFEPNELSRMKHSRVGRILFKILRFFLLRKYFMDPYKDPLWNVAQPVSESERRLDAVELRGALHAAGFRVRVHFSNRFLDLVPLFKRAGVWRSISTHLVDPLLKHLPFVRYLGATTVMCAVRED